MSIILKQAEVTVTQPDGSQSSFNVIVDDTKDNAIEEINTTRDLGILAVENKKNSSIDQIASQYSELIGGVDRVSGGIETKIDKPSASDNDKFPRAKDGDVEWVDFGMPTDEQTSAAVSNWLNAHPEATTTVQDGAVTEEKVSADFLSEIKNNFVTPEMFKSVGDTDDTASLQACFNYAMEHKVWVNLENKTYEISAPLKVTGTIMVQGCGVDSSVIYKSNNTTGKITDEVDAIILIDGQDYNSPGDSTGKYSYYHIFKNFCLRGCTTSYTPGKENTKNSSGQEIENIAMRQYAIYSKNGIIKSQISALRTDAVDVAIYSPKFWNSTLEDCRWMNAHYDGVNFRSEMQGARIVGNNTGGTHAYGYRFGGCAYAQISGNLAEWIQGGTAFEFTSCSGSFDGNGYELGNGGDTGFYFDHSKVQISGATFFSDSDCTAIHANDSDIKIVNSSFGNANSSTNKNYKLCYISESKLVLEGCIANKDFEAKSDILGRSIAIVNGHVVDKVYTASQFITERESAIAQDDKWNLNPIQSDNIRKLRLGMTGYTRSYGDNLGARRSIPKGSVSVNDNAYVTGIAGYVTNISNSKQYTSVTKVNVHERSGADGSGSITFKSNNYFFDSYGTRMYRGLVLEGVTSHARVILGDPLPDGGFSVTESTGQLGDDYVTTVVSATGVDTDRISYGDYAQVPALLAGLTWQRPKSPAVGFCYFDTQIGKPVWCKSNSAGVVVWCDCTGATV